MLGSKAGMLLGFLILAVSQECTASSLTIMAEDAAEPFSRADGTGFANDVVKAAFHAAGADVELDVVPYARCKRDVVAGKIAGCFGMSWYKGVEDDVVFSGAPIFQVHADVFLRRESTGTMKSLADLAKGNVVGIVNDYEYPEGISGLPASGVMFQFAPNDVANLRMLARGRLDAAIVMTNDLEPRMQKAITAGVASNIIYAFRSGTEMSYIGFSLKHPQGMIARQLFDAGHKKIMADGTIDAIRRKWTMAASK